MDTSVHGWISRSAETVYPRTTEIHDVVTLKASAAERRPTRIGLVISDSQGGIVLRRKARAFAADNFGDGDEMAVEWDARDRAGRALAPGRYVATMHARDVAGNQDLDSIVLQVAGKRLVWHTESRTLLAADADQGTCSLSIANGCGEQRTHCGNVLASSRFVGGVSHRSAVCPGDWPLDKAASLNWVTFPEARIRGIDAARVSFTGAPTSDAEQDLGTLRLGYGDGSQSISSASTGMTGWASSLQFGDGARNYGPFDHLPPLVDWWFGTEGEDAFDVASYTVEARYLVED